ncbi:Zinc finger CCCH domain-containing protein 16 [Striga hermonthica]|uniref:Zinc finger CCCH domain-containing protein 16 n=1 Tax=Striga hermonthica TaxID=68872 RepID=A0A9N7P0X9_STRHE|nr:Zinc finger CCCH domain-containing protein 16 [Striga hermonthica]
MPPKKDLCRNFQHGSCRYGDRCKFIHAMPQQQQPKSNPFGFGVQNGSPFQQTNQQQQMSNPFGFGVQNNNKSRGGNDFGSKPSQFKPFENKWSRGASASQQSQNQQSATVHNGSCDIVGDVSCEELRALAYDDSRQGKSLQLIIERERNLLNSKLVEFQNLIQKPYVISSFANPSTQNPFGGGNASTPAMNNTFPSPTSSFNQVGASPNTGPAALPNYTFGQPTAVQNNSQPSNMLQTNNSPFSTPGNIYLFLCRNSTPVGNSNVDDSIWKKSEWKWNVGEIPEEAPPDIYIH